MNIKINFKQPLSKQQVKDLIEDIEVFCACGWHMPQVKSDDSQTCPSCGREFHLQEGLGHVHVIINKPTAGFESIIDK